MPTPPPDGQLLRFTDTNGTALVCEIVAGSAYVSIDRPSLGRTKRITYGPLTDEELRALGPWTTIARGAAVAVPGEIRDRPQCESILAIDAPEGSGLMRCLRLSHGPDTSHSNGDLCWSTDPAGEITAAWFESSPFTETTLGELLRQEQIRLTIPHLASAVPEIPGALPQAAPWAAPDTDNRPETD